MQCLGRLVDDKIVGRFRDGHKFHYELRCNQIVEESPLCQRCMRKPNEERKNHPTALHGLITDEIPVWSHIFGGSWFLQKVSKYGTPVEEEMVKAKAAQEKARKGVTTKAVETVQEVVQEVVEEPVIVKKKKAPKKVEGTAPEVTAPEVAAPIPVEKEKEKEKKKRGPKKVVMPTVEPEHVPMAEIKAVESPEAPIEKPIIMKVRVRIQEIHGKKYFMDLKKYKLYNVGSDRLPGAYHGRWNPTTEMIDTTVPDSDVEATS